MYAPASLADHMIGPRHASTAWICVLICPMPDHSQPCGPHLQQAILSVLCNAMQCMPCTRCGRQHAQCQAG